MLETLCKLYIALRDALDVCSTLMCGLYPALVYKADQLVAKLKMPSTSRR